MTRTAAPLVTIEPWPADGLDLLRRSNTPEMMKHLGGPETEKQLVMRNKRYLGMVRTGQMFRIVLPGGEVAGSVGYWERTWRGDLVYESGYAILSEFQGQGIAVAAVAEVIRRAQDRRRHRHLHAFPSVEHLASNAVCQRAGFDLIEECDFEYPKGRFMRSNNWRLDLGRAAW